MGRWFVGLVVFLFVLFSCLGSVVADVSVGVNVGDWIEYDVITTGMPPEQHNVRWARMDIVDVQGAEIKVNVTTQANNGSFYGYLMHLNLERGEIGAWFIIPKDLEEGDMFFDINFERNFTIEGQEKKSIAGIERTVINASTSERIKQWDKATGVFVLSIDTFPDYTVNATAVKTNMWTPQVPGINQTLLYVVIIAVVVTVVALVLVVRRRKSVEV